MLHALDLTRSLQTAKTPWQAVSKNDNETIECAHLGSAKAAFQNTLAALPLVTYEADETVIADGSRTGRLLILKNGTVTILKSDKEIAKAAEPGAVFGELSVSLDQPHTAEVRALETSQFHIADATALLSQNPTAVLYVATVLAKRLDVANHALIQLKSQLQTGEPHNVIAKTVGGMEQLLTGGGASLVYAGYPYDPFA
jgi:CRP/FNR family transcriptional regulator, cyclic AMP receptor protein